MTRLPATLEPMVRARAEVDDLSFSEVIANAVALYFDHPELAVEPRVGQQERLIA